LMWSHYADQFQGVCLALDTRCFDNGMQAGGFAVKYPPERQSLPPSDYDIWLSLASEVSGSVHQPDAASGLHLTASERAERQRRSFLKLLTHKSPVWEYEREVRLIYDLPVLAQSDNYRKIEFACEACAAKGTPITQCAHRVYRDSVCLPANAIRAVVFGADSPIQLIQPIFDVLAQSRYSHVQVYWSCLHASRYLVQYVRGNRDEIVSIQRQCTEQVAFAKNHAFRDGERRVVWPARKGINYVLKKSVNSQETH